MNAFLICNIIYVNSSNFKSTDIHYEIGGGKYMLYSNETVIHESVCQ